MILGVFLAIGESFRDFKKKGQDKLLLNYNFKTYSQNFDRIYVFSYEKEKFNFFSNVTVLPNKYKLHRYLYSFLLPLFYLKEIRSCDIIRGLQITGGLPALLSKLLFKKKFIVNYGYPYAQTALVEGKVIHSFFYRLLEKLVLNWASYIIVTSKFIQNRLSSYSDRLILIPNGVDTKLFKPITKTQKEFSVMFVGRLEKQKNLFMLINAIALLEKRLRKVLFIGDGSLKNSLLKYAREKDVKLSIYKKISHNNLVKYYNQAQVFVLPSVVEGNPKVLLEAMSCGLPVIGNNVEGIREIIKDGKNGLIFYNSQDSLKKSMTRLLASSKLRLKLSSNARVYIESNFNYSILKIKEVNLLKIVARNGQRKS